MFASLRNLSPALKALLALLAAAVLIGGGWFAWWTLSPLFLNRTVSEDLTAPTSQGAEAVSADDLQVLLSGTFQGADDFHQVSGVANVIDRGSDRILRLEEDFSSTNGPDLFVWLVQGEVYDEGVLDLGPLKGNQGSQNYTIPEGTDLAQYDRVIIWCRTFGVLFGGAPLAPSS